MVKYNAKRLGLIKGSAFMKAIYRVWLGENPASSSLKRKLLGQK